MQFGNDLLVAPFMKRDSNDEGELVSLGASSFSIQNQLQAHKLFGAAVNNKQSTSNTKK